MNKKGLKFLIYILLFFAVMVFVLATLARFGIIYDVSNNNSAGSIDFETKYIKISTVEAFVDKLYNNFDKKANYKLTNDIDLSNYCEVNECKPIGVENSFSGIFDGDGNTIKGLKLKLAVSDINDVAGGLFFSLSGGTVRNLNMKDFKIYSKDNMTINRAGAITGSAYGSVIENCNVEGVIEDAGNYIGLLAGEFLESYLNETTSKIINSNSKGSILNSSNNTSISINIDKESEELNGSVEKNISGTYIGGLVGQVEGTEKKYLSISNCSSDVNINVSGFNVGGLIGNASYVKISNSYSSGEISFSGNYVGGLVGSISHAGINASTSVIKVTTVKIVNGMDSLPHIGGLCGSKTSVDITNEAR